MKKLSTLFFVILFSITTSFSQITDMGIIPVGVTLNSILRLNITSGGNLEFAITTIDQYTGGIDAVAPYITNFTVASSVNFDVEIIADNTDFTGVEDATHTMDVDNLGFSMSHEGSTGSEGGAATDNFQFVVDHCAVSTTSQKIITGSTAIANPSAGGIAQNSFAVHWEFGTQEALGAAGTAGTLMETTTLLAQSLASDRYVVNVFLELIGK